jgi:NADPH:quinone reductase-like Zn-dependent oxidoreductase
MKAYYYTNASGAGTIALGEASMPEPGPGEVRIRMEAASVNYRDLLMLAAAGRGEIKGRIPLSSGHIPFKRRRWRGVVVGGLG